MVLWLTGVSLVVCHLLMPNPVGVHQDGQVDAEDGNAPWPAAMKADQLHIFPHIGGHEGTLQAGRHLIDVLRYQYSLCVQQGHLQPRLMFQWKFKVVLKVSAVSRPDVQLSGIL